MIEAHTVEFDLDVNGPSEVVAAVPSTASASNSLFAMSDMSVKLMHRINVGA